MRFSTSPFSRADAMADPARRLTVRYALALIIVAMLVSGGHFLMVRAVTEVDSDGRVINLAGRQRMLSQRMVKTLAEMSLAMPTRSVDELQAGLLSDLTSWQETHRGLQFGSETLGLPQASDAKIAAMLVDLDDMVQGLAALLLEAMLGDAVLDDAKLRNVFLLSHDFVTDMDRIVFAWQALSEQKVSRLKQLAQAIWLLALLTLAAEAVLIFMPFVRQLARSHQTLKVRALELERLAMVARRTTNSVIITDEHFLIQWVNEGFTRITGYKLVEVAGKSPTMLLSSDSDTDTVALMKAKIRGGLGCRVELLNQRKDGRPIWLDIDVQPLRDENACLNGFISIQSDITERRLLEYHASTDVLTDLPNRRSFFDRLQEERKRAERTDCPGALLMLDIDHFKQVNDVHGHLAGDQVLIAFAEVIRRTIRQTDFPGRLGGEEFGIILPGTSLDAASQLAERLRQHVESQVTNTQDGNLAVTVSIGLAPLSPSMEVGDMIGRADLALYQAKAAGRNQVVVADF